MLITEVITGDLQFDEKLVFKRISGKREIGYSSVTNTHIPVHSFKRIARERFNIKMVKINDDRGVFTYRYELVHVGPVMRPKSLHPCMVPAESIKRCNHVRDCYLSYKCEAAKEIVCTH